MNIDMILETMGRCRVRALLIGGVNFMFRHKPVLTYDIDLWVDDTPENRLRCEQALAELKAEWGHTEADWAPVASRTPGWLGQQSIFCVSSPHGAIDLFRSVRGLPDFETCFGRAIHERTASGVFYDGLSDADMLACQRALAASDRKLDRMQVLEAALRTERNNPG